jgi:hypothetical protein
MIFDWSDRDYEFSNKDTHFLRALNTTISAGTLIVIGTPLGHPKLRPIDFERVIDVLEKVFFIFKDYKASVLIDKFYEFASPEIRDRIGRPVLELIISKYWRPEKTEKKWHTFLRKFWENPDSNDPDITAPFRKRTEQGKMKTRPKMKVHQDRLDRGKKAKRDTIDFVLNDLLPAVFSREAQKQSLAKIHDAKFDLQYEAMCKERGLSV